MSVERLNYYEGQFLKVDDFDLEQNYHITMARLHNRLFHTRGVLEGLLVEPVSGKAEVTISPGVAMDSAGRLLHLTDPLVVDFSGETGTTECYLSIYLNEQESGFSDDQVFRGNSRVLEIIAAEITQALPDAGASPEKVVLAKVSLGIYAATSNPNEIIAVDASVQPKAGAHAGESLTISRDPLSVAGSQALRVDGDAYVTGNVGIGTPLPDRSLTVANTAGANYLNIKDGVREFLMGVDSSGGGILSVMTNHDLIFRSGGNSEKMRIKANGNVGIGTPSPSQKLHVAGIAANTNTGLQVQALDNHWMLFKPSSGQGGHNPLCNAGDSAIIFSGGTQNTGSLVIGAWANSYAGLKIDSKGNVGIGTATPEAKLDVAGNIAMNDTLSTSGRMHITGGELCYMLHKDGVIIGTEWGGNGNLSVQGALSVDAGLAAPLYFPGSTGGSGWRAGIGTGAASPNPNSISVDSIETLQKADGTIDPTLEVFQYTQGKARLHINGDLSLDGNVGIGTSAPSQKLHVAGDIAANHVDAHYGVSVNNGTNSGVDRGIRFWKKSDTNHAIYSASPSGKSTANNPAVPGAFDSNHRLRFRTATGQGFLFENNAEQALVDIDSDNGNLWTRGALHVDAGLAAPLYFPGSTGGSGWRAGIGTGAASSNPNSISVDSIETLQKADGTIDPTLEVFQYTQGKARLHINGDLSLDGNVGIGTGTPSEKLDVHGHIHLTGAIVGPEGTIRDDNGGWVRTYGQTGWYSQSYGGGFYMIDSTWIRTYGSKNFYHNTGAMRTDGTLQVGGDGGTLSVSNGGNFSYRSGVLFANTAGNVGIGTTAPKNKLHIQGASSGPIMSDSNDRPGLAITGHYPQIDLFSSASNTSHGATIRLGGYDADQKNFKHWVIGTAAQNSSFLDIGYHHGTDPNPHAGIRNHNGKTMLTISESGNVSMDTLTAHTHIGTTRLDVHNWGGNSNLDPQWHGIYQEKGDWVHPFPDLVIGHHVGIKIGAHYSLGGVRFYNDAPGLGNSSEIFSVGSGSNNVKANHDLHVMGNVGIGTTAPEAKLDVNGEICAYRRIKAASARTDVTPAEMEWRDSSNGNNWRAVMRKENDGNHWHLSYFANDTWQKSCIRVEPSGIIRLSNGDVVSSDLALKKNISSCENSLEKLTQLRGVRFTWKNNHLNPMPTYGVIAQEVEEVFPDLVSLDRDGVRSVNYLGLLAPVLESIKEQQKKLEYQKKLLLQQQEQIASFEKRASGADFAEYFKSHNGKPIVPGTSVIIENGKIRPANRGEVPYGVISVNPSVTGGYYYEWPKKYLKDAFGNDILEEYKEEIMKHKTEKVKRERQKVKTKTIEEETTEVVEKKINGKKEMVEVKKTEKREIDEPQFNEVKIYDEKTREVIRTEQIPIMETYEEEEPVYDENGQPVMIGTGQFETRTRPKLNPDYDPEREYVPRDQRPEWNIVGLLGQIPLRKGQPTAPGWVKIKEISEEVELWLVK